MGVYIVISTTDMGVVEICEAYAGAESALGRAWSLATDKSPNNPNWVFSNPPEEKLADGSIRWTFLETSKNFVAVYFRSIETALLSKRDPIAVLRDLLMPNVTPTTPVPPVPPVTVAPTVPSGGTVVSAPNEKANMDLPGGWDRKGSAVKLRTVVEDPQDVLPYDQLTVSQKRALATARVAKNPGWVMFWDNHIWTQPEALVELKSNASPIVVERIIDFEVSWLNDLHEQSLDDFGI